MLKPALSNSFGFFNRYINLVPDEDLATAFENQNAGVEYFLNGISEERSAYSYAPGKWTIKTVLQHLIDTEHIFNYRALCFARGEQGVLPGFEENQYAAYSHADKRKWASLVEDFLALRRTTTNLYNSFDREVVNNSGMASNFLVTVTSLGFTSLGHYNHHKNILAERYC